METDRTIKAQFGSSGALELGLLDESELWGRRDSDPRATDELAGRYLAFARSAALRFNTGSEPLDDLFQVACLGLMNAIRRFDPSRGIPFVGFASPTINGELMRHFRDRASTVRLPRNLHDRIGIVEGAVAALGTRLKREPDVSEVAIELDMAQNEVAEALDAARKRRPVSLDAESRHQHDDEPALGELIGSPDPELDAIDEKLMVEELVGELPETEKRLLELRFRDQLTQSEIAQRIGFSQMHVSRLLRRTLDRLRDRVQERMPGVSA